MRLLASTDFALRVLMRLGQQAPGEHVNVETLAQQLGGLSRNHLHKIIQNLTALGVLRTVRGAGGGVMLSVPLAEIRLGALIRTLEADQALVECIGNRRRAPSSVSTPGRTMGSKGVRRLKKV